MIYSKSAFSSLLAALLLAVPLSCAGRNAVIYDSHLYVCLHALEAPEFAHASLSVERRTIRLSTSQGACTLDEGGSLLRLNDGVTSWLSHPLLILSDGYYASVQECLPCLGIRLQPGPSPVLLYQDKRLVLAAEPLALPSRSVQAGPVEPVHRAVQLRLPVDARTELRPGAPRCRLPAQTRLIVRRKMTLDGTPYLIVTCNAAGVESFLLEEAMLERAAGTDPAENSSYWEQLRSAMRQLADRDEGIDCGPRERLPKSVALTLDMCWSLRLCERELMQSVASKAAEQRTTASLTFFLTGRWIEQHPDEMQWLLDLSRSPYLHVIWGVHSWVHPKDGAFMNAFSPRELQQDELRLERAMLRWGLVPPVYYRFPGLIHDRTRLLALLEIDLLAIDCDSWMAMASMNQPPHRMEPRDGSILLLHGNSNEPRGISAFSQWREAHPDWTLAPLGLFLPPPQGQ